MEITETEFESKILKHLSSINYCLESTYSSSEPDFTSGFNYLEDIILLMLVDRKKLIKRISDLEDRSAL
jgi:hypothetical protein